MSKLLALLALACAGLWGPQGDEPAKIERMLVSENGHFQALIRRAKGQEDVDVALARWVVDVSERSPEVAVKLLWTARYPYRGDAMEYRLAQDGSAIAAVARTFHASQPIVVVHRLGEELVKLSGAELIDQSRDLPMEAGARLWLKPENEAIAVRWIDDLFGPEQRLVLETLEGSLHLRLATGELVAAQASLAPIAVAPELLEETKPPSRIPYVTGIDLPRAVDAGSDLKFVVRGSNPSMGWSLAGYLAAYDATAKLLLLETRSRYFPQGGLAAQVLQPFQYPGTLRGLPVGSVRVRLSTSGAPLDEFSFDVLPAGLLLRLERKGGFAGFDDSLELFHHGLRRVVSRRAKEPRFEYVPAATLASYADLLSRMEPGQALPPEGVSDALQFELSWWHENAWVSRAWSEPGGLPPGPLPALLQAGF